MINKKIKIIPIFVPHQGCINDCVFCNQKKITGMSTSMTQKQATYIIERNLKTINKDSEIQIAFYGGSFTAIDLEIQRELLGLARKYKENGQIQKIKLSTRPDYINDNILNILKENKVDIIELGVQSLDEEVLIKNNRGHNVKSVYDAVELIKKYKFTLGLQMMVGLAGDDENKCIKTAKKFIKLKPDLVRIYPTLVLKETMLEEMMKTGHYKPLDLDDAVKISAKLLMMFQYHNINVIRVGLQPTDNITLGNDVLAGPFHSAFRQLTQSRIYKIIIDQVFETNSIKDLDDICIEINKRHISDFVGNRKTNIKHIKETYGIKKVKMLSSNISENIINIHYNNKVVAMDIKKCSEKYLKNNNLI